MARKSSTTKRKKEHFVYQLVHRSEALNTAAKVLYTDTSLPIIREEKKIQERRWCSCGMQGPPLDLVIRKINFKLVG